MRQTVTIEIDVELIAKVYEDGLEIEDWSVDGEKRLAEIGSLVLKRAIDNADLRDWE